MNPKRGDGCSMGLNYRPYVELHGDGWLNMPPLADVGKLSSLEDFIHVDISQDGQAPEQKASRNADYRMNDFLSTCARTDRKTRIRLLESDSRRRASINENKLDFEREIGNTLITGPQPAAAMEIPSWYQQQMLSKKLGAREPLASLSLPVRGRLYFPDASYESVSECTGGSNVSQMVLCHQAKLNTRQAASKPCVALPLPGTTRPMTRTQVSLSPFRYPVSDDPFSPPRCPLKAGQAGDGLETLDHPRRTRCKKISAATKARRQRLSRAVGKIIKIKKESGHVSKHLEDDSTFAQVSPWGTFSCDSHENLSDDGAFSTGCNRHGIEMNKCQAANQKRKPLDLVKKLEGKEQKPCSTQTDASKINMAVQSTMSAIRLHAEIVGKREERSRRCTESKTQRLKNIACCLALPAPPSVAGSDRRLPRIIPSKTTEDQSKMSEEQSLATRSQSSGDLEPLTLSQCDEAAKNKFTTIIEAVRIVERAHARKVNNFSMLDPPWPVIPSLNESLGNKKVSASLSKSCEPSQSSKPDANTANNSSHEPMSAKPARYDPVELLKRFRENTSFIRGKGIGARARAEAANPGKSAVTLKSIVRTIQRAQKRRVMSCISHDRELAIFKMPCSLGQTMSSTPRSGISNSSSKSKSRHAQARRKDSNRGRRSKQTLK